MRRSSLVLSFASFALSFALPALSAAAPQGDAEALPSSDRKADPLEVAAPTPQPMPEPPPSYTPPPPPPPYDEPKEEGFAEGDHFEFTMGFLAGQRSYTDTSFEFEDGNASGIGGAGLVAPFVQPPYNKATVLGLRYEMRLVMSYIRMTAGLDLPFPSYKASDATADYDVGGTKRTVTVQSLLGKELRFGIGGEYPYKSVAVFADLIGGVHWVDTSLSVGGYDADYGATSFAFSGRVGGRAHVRKWFFVTASGEIGIIGDVKWSADLSVGFSIK